MRSPDIVIRSQKVLVRGLRLEAFIGIHDHERDSSQLLLVDVEVDLGCERIEAISGAFNYEAVVLEARKIVSQGHIDLVETFAERLAAACLAHAPARRVRVCALKPSALAPEADAAGVEIVLERPSR
ncbi:dihydroneopterin aldolase [Phenylobacterium sp.]|uniref:dihydroneopterin aldolase n=1 Tax=Phenylobacterium sp. TaxID=1871053 RepID=UPI0025D03159|nr:dihydroneopterin aldolase [Phenylobacterium sp.]